MNTIREADKILSDNSKLLKGKTTCNASKRKQYIDAIDALREIEVSNGDMVLSYDNPDKPYFLHCIYIKWIPNEEDGIMNIPADKISEIVRRFDELTVDSDLPLQWQLSTEIYTEE